MPDKKTGRPSCLANLILMVLVGGMLALFFFVTKSCKKQAEQITDHPGAKPPPGAPAGKEPKETKEPAKKPPEPQPGNVDANTPKTNDPSIPTGIPVPGPGANPPTPPVKPPTPPKPDDDPSIPTAEPVREVPTNSAEGTAMVNDAITRVDEAPADTYSDKAKAKVREGLKTARRIFKVDTVYFEKGGANPDAAAKGHLAKSLQNAVLQEAANDPRAVYFVLGFADKTGNPDTNKKLSRDRADVVIKLLQKDNGVLNMVYPVAIGPTEIVSPGNQQKNRAAEVWLVLP